MDEKLSLLVSHILDRQGYSEEMRQYRISKFDDTNFVSTFCSRRSATHYILAGSKVEGTSRHDESDYDFLIDYSGVKATDSEDIVEGDSDLRLYMETDTVPAGYCKLQLLQGDRRNFFHRLFLNNDCYVTCPGYCRQHLSSTFVASMVHKHFSALYGQNELCGPACKEHHPGETETDQVVAIRCSHFPRDLIKLLFRRHTQAGWPTRQVIELIAKTDVFLVPIGKNGSDHQFLEWRISFNMAEKILIQNFTSVQIKVYILLKKIMKEVVEPRCPKSVTSYIVKTLMLWAVEQISEESWRNDKLLNILVHMIGRLKRCVQYGVCSMYFIPEDNILEGRINEDTQQIVSDVLSSLLDNGCLCILQVPSIARPIYQFMSAIVPVPLHDHYEGTEWEKTIILLNRVRQIHAHSLGITNRDTLLCCLQGQATVPYKELLTDLVSLSLPAGSERRKFIKYLVSQTVSQLALQQCVDAYTQHGSNIQKYTSVRKCVRILHGNFHCDVLCGTVRLAQVFYMLGQYKAALNVLTVGADKVRYYMTKQSRRVTIQKLVCHPRLETAIGNECLSTTQVLQYYSTLDLMFDHLMEPCLPKALTYEVYKSCDKSSKVSVDSETLLYFLQFLCYTQLRQRCLADVAFTNLAQCATSHESIIEYREVALNVLGHLLLKKGLYHQAARVLIKSIMISKLHKLDWKKNAAVWHLAILLNKQ